VVLNEPYAAKFRAVSKVIPLATACDTNVCLSQCELTSAKARAWDESSRGVFVVARAKKRLTAVYSAK
jgi:hypothetical protein